MLKGNWDWYRKREPKRAWKNRELGQHIKWSGPDTPEAPGWQLLGVPPTQVEKEKHQRAWDAEFRRCSQERHRKLELLANEFGVDTANELWPYLLLLDLAEKVAPGFRIDWGTGRGPEPEWDDLKCNQLMADVEIEKRKLKKHGRRVSDKAACRELVATAGYDKFLGERRTEQAKDRAAGVLQNQLLRCRNANSLASRLIETVPADATDVLISIFSPNKAEGGARVGPGARKSK